MCFFFAVFLARVELHQQTATHCVCVWKWKNIREREKKRKLRQVFNKFGKLWFTDISFNPDGDEMNIGKVDITANPSISFSDLERHERSSSNFGPEQLGLLAAPEKKQYYKIKL